MEIYIVTKFGVYFTMLGEDIEEVVGYFLGKRGAKKESIRLQRKEIKEKIIDPWGGSKKSLKDFTENDKENGEFPQEYSFFKVKKVEVK